MVVDPLIELHDVNKYYAEGEGEMVVVIGPSGNEGKALARLRADVGSRELLDRVAIARALAMEPEALLFDEGMTMVVGTHKMGFARSAAHRVAFTADGRSVEDRAPEEFFTAPQSERARGFLSKILKR